MRINELAFTALIFLGCSSAFGFTFSPTTSVTALTSNNTSAAGSWTGQVGSKNGFWDEKPGNVSKVPVSTLIPGHTSMLLVETQRWFCNSSSNSAYCPNSHIQNGEDDSSYNQAVAQVNDIMSRGFNGEVVDWYNPSQLGDLSARNMMKYAQTLGGKYHFAIMIDKGTFANCTDPMPYKCQSVVNSAINYVINTFTKSSAYIKDSSGRPIIYWYINEYMPEWTTVNWGTLKMQGAVSVMLQPDGFGAKNPAPGTIIGEYAWPMSQDGPYVTTSGSMGTFATDSYLGFFSLLNNFYNPAIANPGEYRVAAVYKGFDDGLASWSKKRIIDQQCGNTWLESWNHTGSFAGSSNYFGVLDFMNAGHRLDAIMVDTWDDYEEGTEIETGIDNCMKGLGVSVSGTVVSWSPSFGTDPMNSAISGSEKTIDHYGIYIAQHGKTSLMKLKDVYCSGGTCPHSYDLSGLGITGGPYDYYVQAVGKPSIKNFLGSTGGGSTTSGYTVSIAHPSASLTQTSPVWLAASCSGGTGIDHLEIWLDGVKKTDFFSSSVSTSYSMSPGTHTYTVKCDKSDGTILATSSVTFKSQ